MNILIGTTSIDTDSEQVTKLDITNIRVLGTPEEVSRFWLAFMEKQAVAEVQDA